MSGTIVTTDPIYSKLGSDPELGELVEMFVSEMPDRIAAILARYDMGDFKELARLAHQIKGAAGSYGFNGLTPAAERLEVSAGKNEPADLIREAVDELIEMCGRLRCGAAV
jgi:HPt (histidine-containing phosphotransfer) domain-containing protein